jgi:transcriptional regulator with XRE-family HTH domain
MVKTSGRKLPRPETPSGDNARHRPRPVREAETFNIGQRIRHARLLRNLTLKEVAAASSCTESFVSKLEHNRVKPSITMLHRIAGALNTTVAHLLEAADFPQNPDAIVLNAGRRPLTVLQENEQGDPTLQLEALTPRGHNRLLQASIHHIHPGENTRGMMQGEGETLGYVLSGEIELIVGGESSTLCAGDSFLLPSSLPHGYRNTGSAPASVLWVNTPFDG